MERKDIEAHLVATGWVRAKDPDYFNKDQKVLVGAQEVIRQMRVKFNKQSLTIQLHSSVNSFWLRIGGASYDVIRKTSEGGVQVISYYFPPK